MNHSRSQRANEVKPIVEKFLKDRGLTLSQEKTKIVQIEQGFDFLGWNMRKYDSKMLIKPSKKNTRNFLKEIRETVKANKTAKQEDLIKILNPKIRGWANYHKGVVAKEVFRRVDMEIWKTTWQWAKRRHPHKGPIWVKEKYFPTTGNKTWMFAANTTTTNGKPIQVKLAKASDTKIVRHIKIKAEANPYDPKQEQYFEDRLGRKMEGSLIGKTKLKWLWWSQEKKCPHCGEKITKETGWHIHHILPKSEGGKDNIGNLTLVHPNCHRQIHSLESRCATGS